MHIPDGLLPAPLCLGGYGLTGFTTWLCLRAIQRSPDPLQGVPKAALLTAVFFAASLFHIPIPPTSVHLVLNGLLGVVLGYYAFPAIVVGLMLQAVMFGHGGLSTLGVNALIMGIPALLGYGIFQGRDRLLFQKLPSRFRLGLFAGLAGSLTLLGSVLLFYAIVLLTMPADLNSTAESAAVVALTIAHVPLMVLEGVFTAIVVLFLDRVKPDLLQGRMGA